MIWALLVAAYAVAITLTLFIIVKRRSAPDAELQALGVRALEELPPGERLKALGDVVKIRSGDLRWFERSVSTVGVAAFISSGIVAAIQTMKLELQQDEVRRLEADLESVQARRAAIDRTLASLSRAVLLETDRKGLLTDSEEQVLRLRLEELDKKGDETSVPERFRITWALGAFDDAVALVEAHPEAFGGSAASDRLTLGEYYLLRGNEPAARKTVDDLKTNEASLARTEYARLVQLDACLRGINDFHVTEFARMVGTTRAEARSRLERHVTRVRQALDARRRDAEAGIESERPTR